MLAQSKCYSYMTILGNKLDMVYYFNENITAGDFKFGLADP